MQLSVKRVTRAFVWPCPLRSNILGGAPYPLEVHTSLAGSRKVGVSGKTERKRKEIVVSLYRIDSPPPRSHSLTPIPGDVEAPHNQ